MGCARCAASSGMGGAYPRTEAVLLDYARRKIAAREPFWISSTLNSDVFGMAGMGFLTALVSAVASVAPQVAQAAATVGALKGGGSKAADPDAIAAAILPQVRQKLAAQNVALPPDVAASATRAGILDAFGEQNRPLVIGGAALLGVLLLLRVLR